jgi:hypothetical protein
VNRDVYGSYNPWDTAPAVHRIFVRGLSARTYSNAVGIGLADVTTDRLANSMDPVPTYINSFTGCAPPGCRLPAHFPTDRECIERIAPTTGKIDGRDLRIVWIRNSLELTEFAAADNLIEELRRNEAVEIVGGPKEIEYDEAGNLVEFQQLLAGASKTLTTA